MYGYIIVGWNAMGDEGAIALAKVLENNLPLTILNIGMAYHIIRI